MNTFNLTFDFVFVRGRQDNYFNGTNVFNVKQMEIIPVDEKNDIN